MDIDPKIAKINNCLYRLSVKALVVNDDKVLLVKEEDDDFWDVPGGGIDHGEAINQALVREVSEELGVPVDEITTDYKIVFASLGVVDTIPKGNLFYLVSVPVESIKHTECVTESGWFTPDEVEKLYLNPSTNEVKQWIKENVG